jgi:hypothetical protein
MKPNISQDTKWTWLQTTQGPKHEAIYLQWLEQKMQEFVRHVPLSKPWRRRRQEPTCRRLQINNWTRSCRERTRAETGLGRSAQAGQPSPFSWRSGIPFVLDAPRLINSSYPEGPMHPFTREPHNRRRHARGSRRPPQVLEFPRRWPRSCPTHHGWPCMVKTWWSSGAMPCIHQGNCTLYVRWWYKSCLFLTLIYFDACKGVTTRPGKYRTIT